MGARSGGVASRRQLLLGIVSGATGALLAACGREPDVARHDMTATETPAPTRVILTPSAPRASLPAPTDTTSNAATFVWKAANGLLHPGHLALDGRGALYVTDDENQRVVKFDTNGQFLLAWGKRGTGDGEFRFRSAHQDHSPIAGIAVDARGIVSVTDSTARVQQFDDGGNFLGAWSAEDNQGSLPVIPSGLAINGDGEIYVVDTNNDRILKFTASGRLLRAWGSIGSGDGQFSVPTAIACDGAGNVYVVDINNNRVQKFDRDGRFLGKWGESGFADGRFTGPSGIATDTHGTVFVADTNNHRIQAFTSAGSFVAKWGRQGDGDGEMRDPTDVAVDAQGNVYVVDDTNNRILKFRQS